MKRFFTLLISILAISVSAQDTVRMMQYNVLNYGVVDSYCTTANNGLPMKDSCLRKIIKYIKPDIFTANELLNSVPIHKRMLDSCLNVDGVTHYKVGSMTNASGGDLTNEVFYNSDKFTMISHNTIPTGVRDINIYKFYYKAFDLAVTHDTAYLTRIVVDLKAGNATSDEQDKAAETNSAMGYIISTGIKDNYIFSGDCNVYSDTERCYQNLIHPSDTNFRFNDPVNMIGDWHDNPTYAKYHSQSTHSYSSGCPASGGLDDRFDQMLISNYIKSGSNHFQYIPGSYNTVGQDGNHMNQSVNSGANTSAPDSIIQALYNMSDHLPITLDLRIDETVGVHDINTVPFDLIFKNPVNGNLELTMLVSEKDKFVLTILNLLGQQMFSKMIEAQGNIINCMLPTSNFNKGIYLLKITDSKNNGMVKKFVKE